MIHAQVYCVVACSLLMGGVFGLSFGALDVEDEGRSDRRLAPPSPSLLLYYL